MKKLFLVSILLCMSLLVLRAQPQYSFEQGDTASLIDTIQTEENPANNTETQKNGFWIWLMSGSNIWAVAGVLIALLLGAAQVVTSVNMYKTTASNSKATKHLGLLRDFSREIYIQKEEKLCFIAAIKKEVTEGKMEDATCLVDETVLRNLREAALEQLGLPRKTIKQTTLDEYMDLQSIPALNPVSFKYKRNQKP